MLPKLNVEMLKVSEVLDRDSTNVHTEFTSLDTLCSKASETHGNNVFCLVYRFTY